MRPPHPGDLLCSAAPPGSDPLMERERVSHSPVPPVCTSVVRGLWEVRDRRGERWSVRAHPRLANAWLENGR